MSVILQSLHTAAGFSAISLYTSVYERISTEMEAVAITPSHRLIGASPGDKVNVFLINYSKSRFDKWQTLSP